MCTVSCCFSTCCARSTALSAVPNRLVAGARHGRSSSQPQHQLHLCTAERHLHARLLLRHGLPHEAVAGLQGSGSVLARGATATAAPLLRSCRAVCTGVCLCVSVRPSVALLIIVSCCCQSRSMLSLCQRQTSLERMTVCACVRRSTCLQETITACSSEQPTLISSARCCV